jgi:hypothetical protein
MELLVEDQEWIRDGIDDRERKDLRVLQAVERIWQEGGGRTGDHDGLRLQARARRLPVTYACAAER